jgi:hypothetical protein
MDATPMTIGDLLGKLFPEHDIAAGLARFLTFFDQLAAGAERVALKLCEMTDRLEKAPPVPGYEPLLVEHGQHPLMARALSSWVIRSGRDAANKDPTHRIVADTLRFLAKPGRTRRSISRKAAVLLEDRQVTSALGDALHGSDVSLFEFVESLKGAARGEIAAYTRVTKIAAAVAPGLSAKRGPKVSGASMSHELLLALRDRTEGPKSYTYDAYRADFTDAWTLATRTAWNEPMFDPRPAVRRYKARRGQRSN